MGWLFFALLSAIFAALTAILAAIFLSEKITLTKAAGVVLMVIGAVLISRWALLPSFCYNVADGLR